MKTYVDFMVDINKFTLMFRRGVYPREYIDYWQKFNKISLLNKKRLCSYLNMEDITNANYKDTKRIWKDFEITTLRGYHDLYDKVIHYY